MSSEQSGGEVIDDIEARTLLAILFAGRAGDSARALKAYGALRVAQAMANEVSAAKPPSALPEGPPDPAPAAASAGLLDATQRIVKDFADDGMELAGLLKEAFAMQDPWGDLHLSSRVAVALREWNMLPESMEVAALGLVPEKPSEARAASAGEGALREAARHIVELGYDRATQGARWCRFCGRNPINGHARQLDGDPRPCPLGQLEKALYEPAALAPAQREGKP